MALDRLLLTTFATKPVVVIALMPITAPPLKSPDCTNTTGMALYAIGKVTEKLVADALPSLMRPTCMRTASGVYVAVPAVAQFAALPP